MVLGQESQGWRREKQLNPTHEGSSQSNRGRGSRGRVERGWDRQSDDLSRGSSQRGHSCQRGWSRDGGEGGRGRGERGRGRGERGPPQREFRDQRSYTLSSETAQSGWPTQGKYLKVTFYSYT